MGETARRKPYADIIVDITHEKLDRIYQYRIPEALAAEIRPGVCVEVPFGRSNRLTRAYVLALSDSVDYDPEKIKEIASVSDRGLTIESRLIRLAMWIRQTYGCTMIQALKTVLPVKEKETGRIQKQLQLAVDHKTAERMVFEAEAKHHAAKARLLRHLLKEPVVKQADAARELQIGSATITALARDGIIAVSETAGSIAAAGDAETNGAGVPEQNLEKSQLSEEQNRAVEMILESWKDTPGLYGAGRTGSEAGA